MSPILARHPPPASIYPTALNAHHTCLSLLIALASIDVFFRMTGGTNQSLDVSASNACDLLTEYVTKELLRNIGGDDFVAVYQAKFGYAANE